MAKIQIEKQGVLGRIADWFMVPVMYVLQGNFQERPQQTHRWNNQQLHNYDVRYLEARDIIIVPGDCGANERWWGILPRFHMPILGGWDKFVVLQPQEPIAEWYVGWVAFDTLGVSKIPLDGPVRLGIGPRQAHFFGIDAGGKQIPLKVVGEGRIGQAGQYKDIPLL